MPSTADYSTTTICWCPRSSTAAIEESGSETSCSASTTATATATAAPSANTGVAADMENTDTKAKHQQEEVKGLPAPSSEEAQKLDPQSDQAIHFDHLGPIVVNKDGTMSRITNWDKMAPIEREKTLKILRLRNKARMDKLKEADKEAGGEKSEV